MNELKDRLASPFLVSDQLFHLGLKLRSLNTLGKIGTQEDVISDSNRLVLLELEEETFDFAIKMLEVVTLVALKAKYLVPKRYGPSYCQLRRSKFFTNNCP